MLTPVRCSVWVAGRPGAVCGTEASHRDLEGRNFYCFRHEPMFRINVQMVEIREPTELEHSLDFKFRDVELLTQALTHTTYAHVNGCQHNQRMEFLGDSVLDLIVGCNLLRRFPYAREGELSQKRAEIVRESALVKVAKELRLGPHIRVGPSKEYLREVDSVLADCLEAVIGAVFTDGGLESARAVCRHIGIIE